MKRIEREALDMFSDKSMRMNPASKKRLRKQLQARMRHSADFETRHWYASPWAGGAVAVAALAAFAVVMVPQLTGRHVSRVSAAEVLQKSGAHYQVDLTKYSFFTFLAQYHSVPGHAFEACGKSYDDSVAGDRSSKEYIYHGSDGHEAAYFYEADEQGIRSATHYYNTNSQVVRDYMPESLGVPPYSLEYMVNGHPAYTIVDANGRAGSTELTPRMQDDRKVFDVYLKADPAVIQNKAGCEDVITHVVIDANSYAQLKTETFLGSATEANLIERVTTQVEYKSATEADALRAMTAAGYRKDKALDVMPAGKD